MDKEQKELDTGIPPLPLDGEGCVPLHRAEAGEAEDAAAAAPLLFRAGRLHGWTYPKQSL